MQWIQKDISLSPKRRGFHLVSEEIFRDLPEMQDLQVGLLHLFIRHTSASLSINENADPDVRADMEMAINKIVPESFPYIHTAEGADDMPAHVKSSLIGHAISVPIRDGRADLGTWQGIYLGKHCNQGGSRRVTATLYGTAR